MVSPQPQLPEYPPEGEERTHLETVTKSNAQSNRRKLWPCFENDNWCPPSTSIPNFNKGTLHSCSDKICRWNCLGMQGSLLMAMLDSPLYMTTLTVGRKFSKIICQRALCCRANGFGTSKEAKVEDSSKGNHTRFRLNHPVLMETSVYMDESGTHDMAGIRHVGQDATFDSNLCWVWWPGKTSNFGYAADCLESGLKINYHHSNVGSNMEHRDVSSSIPSTFSECSTYAMFHSIMAISHGSSTVETKMSLSLKDILQRKRNLSFDYESAKDELFRHRVFFQWCRRGCCSRNP